MIKKKKTPRIPFLTLVILLFSVLQIQYSSFAQEQRIDSLRNELRIIKPTITSSLKDSSYVNILNDLAFEISYIQRDSLGMLSEEALLHSKKIGYVKGKIEAYLNLGKFHSDGGRHEKGVELTSKALEKSRMHKLHDLELRAITHLALQQGYLGKNELAFKEMLAGIDIATKLNKKKYLSLFNMNIGALYISLNEYSEALNYLKIAKKFGERYGNELTLASINTNLASAYNHIDKPETGLPFINDAITGFENIKEKDWLAFAYTIKGITYFQQGDFTEALQWFEQSEKLYQTIVDDERSETILCLAMAQTYMKLEKDSISRVHAKRAFDLAEIFKNKERQKRASKLLYEHYKKKGDLAQSFNYLELFQHLSDSLAEDGSKKSMLMLKTQMDYDKQKQELIEYNEKAITKKSNIIAAILAVLFILFGYILLILRNQKIQKKLNLELTKSESELIELNETKNKLFSIISHDLRGPVSAFSQLIEVFSQKKIEKDQFMSFMPKFENDIKHILFTLNNLLLWGRSQMKGMITKAVIVDLDGVVTANVELLSDVALKKSIKILNTIEQQTTVWSDRDQVDVIIRNLISNAIKFTPKNGSVTITAVENNQNVEVSIQDTGVGMVQQVLSKIFNNDSNNITYGTDNEKGTGLGLILCKELVENNKGSIWVKSILNQGSCFTFSLPKSTV